MTPEVIWCREDTDIASAIQLMKEKQIRHLAVGDQHQNLVELVSLYALALRTGDETLAGTAIRWPAQGDGAGHGEHIPNIVLAGTRRRKGPAAWNGLRLSRQGNDPVRYERL
jgi:Mg/Co/Ni transporter MgtE